MKNLNKEIFIIAPITDTSFKLSLPENILKKSGILCGEVVNVDVGDGIITISKKNPKD